MDSVFRCATQYVTRPKHFEWNYHYCREEENICRCRIYCQTVRLRQHYSVSEHLAGPLSDHGQAGSDSASDTCNHAATIMFIGKLSPQVKD